MIAPSSSQLLTLWEQGERRHALDRGLLLYGFAAPETPLQTLADAPLGQCNMALMRLRETLFGSRLSLWADCPGCGQRMQFELDPAQLPPTQVAAEWIEVQGLRFRCPTSRDLAEIAHCTDLDQAADQLLRACAAPEVRLPNDPHAMRSLRDAVENALETADPWSDLSLLFQCPACDYRGDASLDIGRVLWENLDARARHLLNEVHLLAQAYGWSEPQILALSDTRRAAYLARVAP
jgi:hypothetical protein